MIRIKIAALFIGLLIGLPGLSVAQDFDGSKPLLCAVVEVVECAPAKGCIKGVSENWQFPQFVKIDFKQKMMTGLLRNEARPTAPIDKVEVQEGRLILHGTQNGRAWNMVISQKTGHMTGTIAADDFSFTVFGACIVQ